MADDFLNLSRENRAAILADAAGRIGRSAPILEKDVWVCWTLKQLFTMPGRRPMAFKGGTSLSKVFRAINRFSEDVDVTLDYRGLEVGADPFAEGVSKSRLKKFSDKLKAAVQEHVTNLILPGLQSALSSPLVRSGASVEVNQTGEELRVYYPSALEAQGSYLKSSVLIEFGGRNITEPNEEHRIVSDMAELFPDVAFPTAQVMVLAPERTFWEKATLIHVECNRNLYREGAERLSRHWYDLAMLAKHEIGRKALLNRGLLTDVVKRKKVFFDASYAHYEDCLTGKLRLIPEEAVSASLRADYRQMVTAGMFYGDQLPSFDDILAALTELETAINRSH